MTISSSWHCAYDNWKLVFAEQREPGTLRIWSEPFVTLRVPKLFNLRTDPFERADITSITYYDWLVDHVYLLVPAQAYVGEFLADIQGLPAAPEGRQLQPRRGPPEDAGGVPTRNPAAPASRAQAGIPAGRRALDRGMADPRYLGSADEARGASRRDGSGGDENASARRSGRRGARVLREPPLSGADRQPRSAPRALSKPGSASGIVASAVADEKPRANREILVAGCGTSQAAIHALREPDARVTAIDISETSLRHTRDLQRKYGLRNLDLHRLAIEAGRGARARCSTRSSVPACSITCPTRIPAFGHCAMSSCAQRRDAPDGLCDIWACRHLHDAGVLPPARGRRHGGRAARPRRDDRGTALRPSDRRRGEAGEGFHPSGRAGRCTAPPPGPRLHRAAALCMARGLRPVVRALVRAGSLSPAMRGNGDAPRTPRVSSRFRRDCSMPRSSYCAGP